MILNKVAQVLDGINNLYVPTEDLEEKINHLSTSVVLVSAVALVVLVVIAALLKDKVKTVRAPLFGLIALVMAGSTLFLAGSTVYLNVKADSGGPVHWHADFEIWACDSQLELRNPTGFLSNKIGTSVLHEHDDQRIHLEGVVVDDEVDASLGKFFHVIGGALTDKALVVPLNETEKGTYFEEEEDGDGKNPGELAVLSEHIVTSDDGPFARFENGQNCNGEPAEVQTFVYKVNKEDKNTYTQTKLENPRDYVIADDSNVPDGDCVIFEFGPARERTDKLCSQYGIRDIEKCERYGVEESKRGICTMHEVDKDGNIVKEGEEQQSTSDSNSDQTSQPADQEEPDPDVVAAEAEIVALCKQYFNADGTPTGIEIAAVKADGTNLKVETECEEYRLELIGNPTTETEAAL